MADNDFVSQVEQTFGGGGIKKQDAQNFTRDLTGKLSAFAKNTRQALGLEKKPKRPMSPGDFDKTIKAEGIKKNKDGTLTESK